MNKPPDTDINLIDEPEIWDMGEEKRRILQKQEKINELH
jgi:hypothetical protein